MPYIVYVLKVADFFLEFYGTQYYAERKYIYTMRVSKDEALTQPQLYRECVVQRIFPAFVYLSDFVSVRFFPFPRCTPFCWFFGKVSLHIATRWRTRVNLNTNQHGFIWGNCVVVGLCFFLHFAFALSVFGELLTTHILCCVSKEFWAFVYPVHVVHTKA